MIDKEYVKVYCCADCAHYDMKKHRCRNGAKDEGTGREHFYRDCCLGIHNENESVPIEEVLKIIEFEEKWLSQTRMSIRDIEIAFNAMKSKIKQIEGSGAK